MANFQDKLKDLLWSFKKNKKAQIITAVLVVLVLALVLLYLILQYSSGTGTDGVDNTNDRNNGNANNEAQVGETSPRRIDGVETNVTTSNLQPVAIVIENLSSIRPQAALGKANLVYETLAEGGITRFLAVYAGGEDIERIGPVRSARHYFVDWAEEYGGIFAHIGGSPQALGILGTSDYMTDLNQFGYSQYYYRDDNIGAPHNLFTTSELMSFALRDLEVESNGDYDPFLFKDDAEKQDRPEEVNNVVIDFSSTDYLVEWEYDRDTNSYLRWNGGEEHVDANTSEQIRTKNIAVQYAETSLLEADSGRIDVVTIGEGEAIVFQDGVAVEGRWEKVERGDRTKFYDTDGEEIKFNAGTTWIEVVPNDREVTY